MNFISSILRLTLLTSLVLLTACGGGKIVKTYEGDAVPPQQLAVLTAGENVTLLSVNGKSVPKYLLSNIEVDYGLLPGANKVVFQYRSVWSNGPRKDEDAPRAVEIESPPMQVAITAAAGDRLVFEYPQADNIREARSLAENFSARIVNQKGKELGVATAYTAEQVQEVDLVNVPVTAPAAAVPVSSSVPATMAMTTASPNTAPTTSLPTIDALKVLWESASADEKKAFLKWAFK